MSFNWPMTSKKTSNYSFKKSQKGDFKKNSVTRNEILSDSGTLLCLTPIFNAIFVTYLIVFLNSMFCQCGFCDTLE